MTKLTKVEIECSCSTVEMQCSKVVRSNDNYPDCCQLGALAQLPRTHGDITVVPVHNAQGQESSSYHPLAGRAHQDPTAQEITLCHRLGMHDNEI